MHFTLITFSTVGFGDLTARSRTGRLLTMAQMAGGAAASGRRRTAPASAVQAWPLRQRGGPSAKSRAASDVGTPDREAGP
ncbi:potassium channel family protein [Streptomyces sp. NPDC005492]|uniref:potassium channel family protein n=1 Tax=Streptomyces sp. NPDC005492 TaxID=3156883 RepID=UPI0033A0F861